VLAGATDIRPGEGRAVLASGLLFFLVLAAIMVLRPVREAMGLVHGIENVRSLFLCTVAVTLLLVPLFGYLVSRLRRPVFFAVSFHGCALILLGFYVSLTVLPEPLAQLSKQVYYVYHSVFNLFVVSLFWALMADLFSISESKRLFPAIAVGGTLGAICGPFVSAQLASRIGVEWLFLLAAGLLELAVGTAALVARTRASAATQASAAYPIGGHPLAGITLLARSPYLLGIALVIVPSAVISTFFYFTKMRIVEAAVESLDERAVLFARIDFWTQLLTLLAQAFLAGRIMRLMGVGAALAVLPLASVGGFAVLAATPTLRAYMVVNAIYLAVERGITRPARETLFTVLPPEEKYKVKSFLDTFGFRAGDATGSQLERPLRELTPGLLGLTAAVLPIALFWAALALLLGRAQSRLAARQQLGST
jgi:AAA family ATP:ADP antiporter